MTIGWRKLLPFMFAPLLGCAANQPDQTTAQIQCAYCTLAPATEPSGEVADGKSLFDRDWIWENDSGRMLKLSELKGRPQVMVMYFSACAGTCGMSVSRLQQVEASLPTDIRRQTGFVLVTFDSDHDTPQVLSSYRARRQLPTDRWTILRGDRKSTRELANALGVTFVQDPVRRYLHSAQITVLDASGHVVKRATGLHSDLAEVVNAVCDQFSTNPTTHP